MSYLIKYATSFCVTKFPSRYLRPTLMFIDPLPVIRPNSILVAEFMEIFGRAILEFYHRFKIGIADFTFFRSNDGRFHRFVSLSDTQRCSSIHQYPQKVQKVSRGKIKSREYKILV